MIIAALVLAGIAAAIHVYIFVLESILCTGARARRTFGTTVEEARITRPLALNQGFYNLFLAIAVGLWIVLVATGPFAAGVALVFAGAGSMVAAGLVLIVSSPDKARSALVQLVPPLVAVVLLIVALIV